MVYVYHARILDEVKAAKAFKSEATPFKSGNRAVVYNDTEPARSQEDSIGENVVDNPGSLRITTKANIPYNIEGYERNAMLMMNRAAIDQNNPFDDTREKMNRVTTVFEKFRFQIESYRDLTDDQIDEKCQDFFERDFTDYGCVAVVLIKPDGCNVEDTVVVRHWTANGNPTLRNKPKLYINETSHHNEYRRVQNLGYYSVPITDDHPHVLCLHIPALLPSYFEQPMQILCDKLTTMPHDHVLAIIKEAIEDSSPTLRTLTYVATTQDKKLFLARNEAED